MQPQTPCRTANYKVFKEYSALVNDQSKQHATLRGLLDLKLCASTPDLPSRK